MSIHSRGSYVEGIGDDAFLGVVGLISVIMSLVGTVFYWNRQREGSQSIHPDSQESIQDTRTHLPNHEREGPRRNTDNDLTCPICIAQSRFAVETNCGHLFCGECVVTYWRHGNWLGAIKCPVCRQQVNILLRSFSEEEMNTDSDERTQIVREINHYNRRFSGQPLAWLDYLRDLPTLLRHAIREFFSVSGLLLMFRLRVVVLFLIAVIYFISPLDIIPEAVFGILGFLDDLFILLLLAIYLSVIYRNVVNARANQA